MKTGVLFSGGKDSCLALYKFGKENIDVLLSILPKNKDSWMFHKPNLKLLKKQAEMLDLPLVVQKTVGEKEGELEDLKELLKKSEINKLVVGGLASNYQAGEIKKISDMLGIKLFSPLWNYKGERLWKELLNSNFKIILTKISCDGLGKEWLGVIINPDNFQRLKKLSEKFRFDLTGEGGDFETAVLWMPCFKRKIEIKGKTKSEGSHRHFLEIVEVR